MKFLFASIIILLSNLAHAQRACGTMDYARSISPQIDNSVTSLTGRDTLNNELINIPVVIHLLYKEGAQNMSNAQILSQLTALNNDFSRANADKINTPSAFRNVAADCRIKFCLAKVDPRGRPTSGILRKYTNTSAFLVDDEMKFSSSGGDDAWDSKRYLNIWVCNLLGRNLGYATFPGGAADRDGIVIQYDVFGITGNLHAPYDKGRTATHEIGHWLGLKHIWGDADCGSDDIADTPPQKGYSNGCFSFPHTSTCSVNQYGDMFMNFMDFTDDACMNMFTTGQKIKIRSLFAAGAVRNSFLNSNACDSAIAEEGPVPVDLSAKVFSVEVYPNPVINKITIKLTNNVTTSNKYALYNSIGFKILSGIFSQSLNTLNLTTLPAGIYILKLGEGKDQLTKKIIKI